MTSMTKFELFRRNIRISHKLLAMTLRNVIAILKGQPERIMKPYFLYDRYGVACIMPYPAIDGGVQPQWKQVTH